MHEQKLPILARNFPNATIFTVFQNSVEEIFWPRAANAPISYSIAKRNLIGQDSARSSNSEKSRQVKKCSNRFISVVIAAFELEI